MTWINDDGLEVKFGLDEAEKANLTEYTKLGSERELELLIKWDELPAVADNSVVVSRQFVLPAGAHISELKLTKPSTDFASAGGTMTLNIGIVDADGTSNPDVDGLVAAATITELNAGGTNTAGWVGASYNAVLARDSLLTWEQDTQASTAGETVLTIKYYIPKTDADTLVYAK